MKVAISAMQSLTQEKNSQIKFLPMRAGGKIDKSLYPIAMLLLSKILAILH